MKKILDKTDKRKFRRIKVNMLASVAGKDTQLNINITNIGEKGLEFFSTVDKQKFSPNDYILIDNISHYQNFDPLTCKILWSKMVDNKVLYGAEFTKYSDNNIELLEKIFNNNSKKLFVFKKNIYIGDTNLEGNVYFAKYVDWQGMAREEFYRRHFNFDFIKEKVNLITLDTYVKYRYPLFLFDTVLIFVNTANLQKARVDLIFNYIEQRTGKLVAEGKQSIAFKKEEKIIKIPEQIRNNIIPFLL